MLSRARLPGDDVGRENAGVLDVAVGSEGFQGVAGDALGYLVLARQDGGGQFIPALVATAWILSRMMRELDVLGV